MISKKIAAALNDQVNNEFQAYWSYLAMSFACEAMGFGTFGKWFHAQAIEEQGHALKFTEYLSDQGVDVNLAALTKPKANYKSVEEVTKTALKQEQGVTASINKIVKLARAENDYATENFLQWFIQEQVEEEATFVNLLELIKMCSSPGQLLMLEGRIMSLREH